MHAAWSQSWPVTHSSQWRFSRIITTQPFTHLHLHSNFLPLSLYLSSCFSGLSSHQLLYHQAVVTSLQVTVYAASLSLSHIFLNRCKQKQKGNREGQSVQQHLSIHFPQSSRLSSPFSLSLYFTHSVLILCSPALQSSFCLGPFCHPMSFKKDTPLGSLFSLRVLEQIHKTPGYT